MTPLAWTVIAVTAIRGTAGLTRAGLSYRTSKRRDEAKGQVKA